MRLLSPRLLGLLALLALAGPARAANIDTTGSDSGTIFTFGASNTATYGQTFTPDSSQTLLTGFSLFLRERSSGAGTLDLRGYIAGWDGTKATSILYESPTRTMNAAGTLQEFAFAPNLALTAGSTYVAFLSISNLPAQSFSQFGMPVSGAVIPGSFVYLNNGTNFASLLTDTWSQGAFGRDDDAWFTATFGTVTAVPEPASLALLGIGLAGLGLVRRRTARR